MIDIKPETRMVYWNETLRDTWIPRIERVSKAYHDTELATVLAGMRRVFVYHVRSDRFGQSYAFLRKNGLVFYPTNKSGIYQGFSHKHRPIEKGKPYMLYGAAVRADDEEAGELFTKYSTGGSTDHEGIGDLLGYPKCCQKFFKETWPNVSVDPIYEAALNTKGAREKIWDKSMQPILRSEKPILSVACHPFCNNMLRYFGIRITPHLTCSMQCEKTIAWGEEWFDIMKQVDEEAADWAKELLSMPLTWNCYKGIVIIDTPLFRATSNSDTTMIKKIVENRGWGNER